MDGLALAAAIAEGRISAVAALEAALERAGESGLGAIARLAPEAALAEARRIDAGEVAPAPFLGVPFLMKDLGAACRGLPKTCGSRAVTPDAQADSDLAAAFRKMGLLPFGVTAVPEFGLGLTSEPANGPPARNPLNPALTPGGSSGGAAAAVAAGIVALAHATDAGGSIRVPAACCGLVGLKASRGVSPGGPGFGNHLAGLAEELVVSRSLRDTAAVLDGLSGAQAMAQLETRLPRLRVGLVADAGAAPERLAAVRDAAAALAAEGHEIVPLAASRLAGLCEGSSAVLDAVICVNLARVLPGAANLQRLTAAAWRRGRGFDGVALQEAEILSVKIGYAMERLFQRVDVLLTPMLAGPPLAVGALPMDHEDVLLHWRRMDEFAPFAKLANVAGVPALCLPFGADAAGLPLPVQIMGPAWSDALLLQAGEALRKHRPWAPAPLAGMPG